MGPCCRLPSRAASASGPGAGALLGVGADSVRGRPACAWAAACRMALLSMPAQGGAGAKGSQRGEVLQGVCEGRQASRRCQHVLTIRSMVKEAGERWPVWCCKHMCRRQHAGTAGARGCRRLTVVHLVLGHVAWQAERLLQMLRLQVGCQQVLVVQGRPAGGGRRWRGPGQRGAEHTAADHT
jgi:hypothetical protein